MWHPSHDHPQSVVTPVTSSDWLSAANAGLSLVGIWPNVSLPPPSETVSEIHVILAHWSTKWRGLTKVWVLELKGTTHQNYIFILAVPSSSTALQPLIEAGKCFMKMILSGLLGGPHCIHTSSDYSQGQQSVGQRLRWAGPSDEDIVWGIKQKKRELWMGRMAHF